MDLRAGTYDDLRGAAIVMITAGANERKGGATDRNDPAGRLSLLATNATVYRDIVPRIVAAAPDALLLVITDPPDPLADVARGAGGHIRVLSSGTLLDSLRFRFHLGKKLGVDHCVVHCSQFSSLLDQPRRWSSESISAILTLIAA